MRASGHWATAMFAIFFALYDSIQASRLILRAPTVSPSIRNMYNSTACFFFLSFVHKHTLILLPALSDEAIQGKKRIVCLGNREKGRWGVEELLVGLCRFFFSFSSVPRVLPMQVQCCSLCRDTNRLSHGRTLPTEQSPTPILPANCQPVISNSHSGPDAHRKGKTVEHMQQPRLPEPEGETTVVSMQRVVCTIPYRGKNWLCTEPVLFCVQFCAHTWMSVYYTCRGVCVLLCRSYKSAFLSRVFLASEGSVGKAGLQSLHPHSHTSRWQNRWSSLISLMTIHIYFMVAGPRTPHAHLFSMSGLAVQELPCTQVFGK